MRRAFACLFAVWFAIPCLAADGPELTIQWFGQSFFVVQSSTGTRVAFDPHAIDALGRPSTKADIVLMSHPHSDHTQLNSIENRATARIFEGVKVTPPTSEGGPPKTQWNPLREIVRDVAIRTVPTYHDTMQGLQRGKNSVFILEIDGLKVVHLGDLGHVLAEEQVKQIGPVDVLMIPVGGVYTINGDKAKEVLAQLKPKRLILPMHFGIGPFEDLPPLDEFIDGQANILRTPKTNEFKLPIRGNAPKEPTIVLLNYKKE